MGPKIPITQNGSMTAAPQNLSVLQENGIPISQNPAHSTSSQDSVPPTMNSGYQNQQENYCPFIDFQNNPSWPAPSFTALLTMDFSFVLAAEILLKEDPTDLLQSLTPTGAQNLPDAQSLFVTNSNNLPPLQPPNLHASPATALPSPNQAPANGQASRLRSSLGSTLHPRTSIQQTQAMHASLRRVTPDPPIARRAYTCILCGSTFYNAQALGGHMSYHSKGKIKKQVN